MKGIAAVLLAVLASSAQASEVRWTVDVLFNDGGTATGSFLYDADAGPNGTFANFNIVTQGGTSGLGMHVYLDLIQQAPFFVRLVPNASIPDLTGRPVLTLAWVLNGATQYGWSYGLTDAGGLVQAVGMREELCGNANCTAFLGGNSRLQAGFQGVLSGTPIPEPSSSVLMALGCVLIARRRWTASRRPITTSVAQNHRPG